MSSKKKSSPGGNISPSTLYQATTPDVSTVPHWLSGKPVYSGELPDFDPSSVLLYVLPEDAAMVVDEANRLRKLANPGGTIPNPRVSYVACDWQPEELGESWRDNFGGDSRNNWHILNPFPHCGAHETQSNLVIEENPTFAGKQMLRTFALFPSLANLVAMKLDLFAKYIAVVEELRHWMFQKTLQLMKQHVKFPNFLWDFEEDEDADFREDSASTASSQELALLVTRLYEIEQQNLSPCSKARMQAAQGMTLLERQASAEDNIKCATTKTGTGEGADAVPEEKKQQTDDEEEPPSQPIMDKNGIRAHAMINFIRTSSASINSFSDLHSLLNAKKVRVPGMSRSTTPTASSGSPPQKEAATGLLAGSLSRASAIGSGNRTSGTSGPAFGYAQLHGAGGVSSSGPSINVASSDGLNKCPANMRDAEAVETLVSFFFETEIAMKNRVLEIEDGETHAKRVVSEDRVQNILAWAAIPGFETLAARWVGPGQFAKPAQAQHDREALHLRRLATHLEIRREYVRKLVESAAAEANFFENRPDLVYSAQQARAGNTMSASLGRQTTSHFDFSGRQLLSGGGSFPSDADGLPGQPKFARELTTLSRVHVNAVSFLFGSAVTNHQEEVLAWYELDQICSLNRRALLTSGTTSKEHQLREAVIQNRNTNKQLAKFVVGTPQRPRDFSHITTSLFLKSLRKRNFFHHRVELCKYVTNAQSPKRQQQLEAEQAEIVGKLLQEQPSSRCSSKSSAYNSEDDASTTLLANSLRLINLQWERKAGNAFGRFSLRTMGELLQTIDEVDSGTTTGPTTVQNTGGPAAVSTLSSALPPGSSCTANPDYSTMNPVLKMNPNARQEVQQDLREALLDFLQNFGLVAELVHSRERYLQTDFIQLAKAGVWWLWLAQKTDEAGVRPLSPRALLEPILGSGLHQFRDEQHVRSASASTASTSEGRCSRGPSANEKTRVQAAHKVAHSRKSSSKRQDPTGRGEGATTYGMEVDQELHEGGSSSNSMVNSDDMDVDEEQTNAPPGDLDDVIDDDVEAGTAGTDVESTQAGSTPPVTPRGSAAVPLQEDHALGGEDGEMVDEHQASSLPSSKPGDIVEQDCQGLHRQVSSSSAASVGTCDELVEQLFAPDRTDCRIIDGLHENDLDFSEEFLAKDESQELHAASETAREYNRLQGEQGNGGAATTNGTTSAPPTLLLYRLSPMMSSAGSSGSLASSTSSGQGGGAAEQGARSDTANDMEVDLGALDHHEVEGGQHVQNSHGTPATGSVEIKEPVKTGTASALPVAIEPTGSLNTADAQHLPLKVQLDPNHLEGLCIVRVNPEVQEDLHGEKTDSHVGDAIVIRHELFPRPYTEVRFLQTGIQTQIDPRRITVVANGELFFPLVEVERDVGFDQTVRYQAYLLKPVVVSNLTQNTEEVQHNSKSSPTGRSSTSKKFLSKKSGRSEKEDLGTARAEGMRFRFLVADSHFTTSFSEVDALDITVLKVPMAVAGSSSPSQANRNIATTTAQELQPTTGEINTAATTAPTSLANFLMQHLPKFAVSTEFRVVRVHRFFSAEQRQPIDVEELVDDTIKFSSASVDESGNKESCNAWISSLQLSTNAVAKWFFPFFDLETVKLHYKTAGMGAKGPTVRVKCATDEEKHAVMRMKAEYEETERVAAQIAENRIHELAENVLQALRSIGVHPFLQLPPELVTRLYYGGDSTTTISTAQARRAIHPEQSKALPQQGAIRPSGPTPSATSIPRNHGNTTGGIKGNNAGGASSPKNGTRNVDPKASEHQVFGMVGRKNVTGGRAAPAPEEDPAEQDLDAVSKLLFTLGGRATNAALVKRPDFLAKRRTRPHNSHVGPLFLRMLQLGDLERQAAAGTDVRLHRDTYRSQLEDVFRETKYPHIRDRILRELDSHELGADPEAAAPGAVQIAHWALNFAISNLYLLAAQEEHESALFPVGVSHAMVINGEPDDSMG
ncbi:unnamed protein product [Amoebophrya sp. A120]|nr:unnamed protein product [Amoebophrya sp. A120]|eukprot:GSA120T00003592001.1